MQISSRWSTGILCESWVEPHLIDGPFWGIALHFVPNCVWIVRYYSSEDLFWGLFWRSTNVRIVDPVKEPGNGADSSWADRNYSTEGTDFKIAQSLLTTFSVINNYSWCSIVWSSNFVTSNWNISALHFRGTVIRGILSWWSLYIHCLGWISGRLCSIQLICYHYIRKFLLILGGAKCLLGSLRRTTQ